MALTLKEAAEQTGKTKPGILKAIQKGRLSATRDENGQWWIEPVELFRVYQPHKQETVELPEGLIAGSAYQSPELTIRVNRLEVENEGLRERLTEMRNHVQDIKSQRDEWREQAQRLALEFTRKTQEESAKEQGDPAKPAPNDSQVNSNQDNWLFYAAIFLVFIILGLGLWLSRP